MEGVTVHSTIRFIVHIFQQCDQLRVSNDKVRVNDNISYLYDIECKVDKYILVFIEYNSREMIINISRMLPIMPIISIDDKILSPEEINRLKDIQISAILA